MDLRTATDRQAADTEPAQAVLAEVTCTWSHDMNAPEQATAVVVHAAREMLVLEASNSQYVTVARSVVLTPSPARHHWAVTDAMLLSRRSRSWRRSVPQP